MPAFSDYSFLSANRKTQIHVRRCTPDAAPRAIVQLAHGICEYIDRYDAFAEFLASKGFLVVGNDHLGHGKSFSDEEDKGFFAESSGWELAVNDMHQLHKMTAEEFPGLPYFLFGHSMGSFLTRTYIIKYPSELSGAVICGTGQQSNALIQSGRKIGRTELHFKGAKFRSQLLNNMAFGSYNSGFEEKRTPFDWLTRDTAVVDAYIADPLCGFVPTAGLFTDMMDGIAYISRSSNLQRMDTALPVLFISGDRDPVGENGKGVLKAYTSFLNAGMTDVTLKLYHDCRHEILNELCRAQVMNDVAVWINSKM